MNSIEQENINGYFGDDSDGKTMENYFEQVQIMIGGAMSIDELKTSMKQSYPDETDWSF